MQWAEMYGMMMLVAALLALGFMPVAEAVEVCRVVDLELVTQTGEFFLAGSSFYPDHPFSPRAPRPTAEACGCSAAPCGMQSPRPCTSSMPA